MTKFWVMDDLAKKACFCDKTYLFDTLRSKTAFLDSQAQPKGVILFWDGYMPGAAAVLHYSQIRGQGVLIQLERIDSLASDVKMFWFRPAAPLRYTAGQFIELFLPHAGADKRGQKRWFTLSSSPTEPLLAITTRQAAEAGSSFKAALFDLQPGAELDMSMPMGDFVLPKDSGQKLLFIAGGIGITPMRSMVKYLIDTGGQRDITLIHSVRQPGDLFFKDIFQDYGLHYAPYTQALPLDAKAIDRLALGLIGKRIYLSGPEPMTAALYKELRAAGVARRQLITDYFPGYKGI